MPLAGKTILQVIPDLDAGGAERTTIEIAEALTKAGAKALVASRGGRLEAELKAVGGELIALPKAGSKSLSDLMGNADRIAQLVKQRDVSLIHARSRAPGWSSLWAARRTQTKFVTTYHGVYSAKSSAKRLYNSVMARGHAVIANSEFTAAHIRAQHPKFASRIVVVPRGVDLAKFSASDINPARTATLSASWSQRLNDQRIVILLPGRLTSWKGQLDAVAAAAKLASEGRRDFRMIFAGDAQGRDGYVKELDKAITEASLGDTIFLAGHCTDMPAAFAVSDIVIAPSNRPEAFGRVAAEAGAMERCVVGSAIGGQAEVIVSGETGVLTPPGDPAALARAIAGLIDAGPAKRAEMGAKARARIAEKYTTQSLQRATLAVYDSLIGGTA